MKNKYLLFQEKYRIPSARLEGWDYRNPELYFVTICTKKMKPQFGEIVSGIMKLNQLGQFAYDYMADINNRKENAMVINHIVMPNHVHAIIKLTNKIQQKELNQFGPLLPGSLSSLINHYKGSITKYAKLNNLYWDGWQGRFHDHIIRNTNQFDKINEYISTNPIKWKKDRYYL